MDWTNLTKHTSTRRCLFIYLFINTDTQVTSIREQSYCLPMWVQNAL